ncbi:oligogalacturonate lyase [Peptococcaceae bacterium CEB3]|nr:oligogalacturonate lyase [Peptococcaceae bacterium CEB3]
MNISGSFIKTQDPETGRNIVKLTSGQAFCYPLYYFIPTISKDMKYLIYHRAENGEVQLHRLDLETGENKRISNATCDDTWWRPWCSNSGKGVLDHRSVLNVETNKVIYFDGNTVRMADVETLEDKILFELPKERTFIGQNCVTPNGKLLIFIHADKKLYETMFDGDGSDYWQRRSTCKGTSLCSYDFSSGEIHTILNINSPIHHVMPYDDHYLVFCHPASENGMLFTDINGGWYTHLRTQDNLGGTVCHFLVTEKGISYEIMKKDSAQVSNAGMYNPFTHKKYEIRLPEDFGYTHTGRDSEGRAWFFEEQANIDGNPSHNLHYLVKHDGENDVWLKLIGGLDTYGVGQKAHFHPVMLPGREWILMTGGDRDTQTNQIYLVDVSDLKDTEGMPEV